MKRILCLIFGMVLISFPATAHSAQAPTLRYITEESPPDNFTENGVLQGVAVEALHDMWKAMGTPRQPIEVLPWARAYREAQEVPNTVLFSIVRNAEREPLFKWAGPIRTTRYVLVAPRQAKLWLTSPQELQKYTIGTVIDDICEQLLLDYGIPLSKLDRVSSSTLNFEKFKNGRFDLLPFSETGISSALKSQGMDPQNYRVVFTLAEKQLYYAFHKDTPDAIVLRFQQALDTIRTTGAMNSILKKYDIIPLDSADSRL